MRARKLPGRHPWEWERWFVVTRPDGTGVAAFGNWNSAKHELENLQRHGELEANARIATTKFMPEWVEELRDDHFARLQQKG